MNNTVEDSFIGDYEETYNGYDIFVIENPDRYRGGFEWSVCKDAVELDSGLEFIAKIAIESAHKIVDSLVKNANG
jgi:hypothetical protein